MIVAICTLEKQRTTGCPGLRIGCLRSPILALTTWKIPEEPLVFIQHWNSEKLEFGGNRFSSSACVHTAFFLDLCITPALVGGATHSKGGPWIFS